MKSFTCSLGLHKWNGCVCVSCGAKRDMEHDWDGCTCKRCGVVKHDYEVVEEHDKVPDCIWSSGDPCTGPGCCSMYPGPGTRWQKLRCKDCGHEIERKFDIGDEFVQYYPAHNDE